MEEEIKRMPKIELHLHFDGSVAIPLLSNWSKLSKDEVEKKVISDNDKSLKEYLDHFDFVLEYLQTKENLYLASKELGETLDKENVIYAEIRFAPLSHIKKGLTLDEVIESIQKGLSECKVKTNLILCMRRGDNIDNNMRVIELANKYLNKGVVAVDLVGDEDNYPFVDYKYLFNVCKYANIPVTIHAGETTKRDILETINYTKRLGHGIKIFDDEELIREVIKNNCLLEVCPNSNLDTKNILDYYHHPIRIFYDKGVKVCINTDNRTVSNISLNEEYINLIKYLGFTKKDLLKMNLNAIDGAFISIKEKEELKKIITEK